MPTLTFNRGLEEWAKSFFTGAFKVMLTTSAYAEDKDTHDFRNDVTNEVTGTGYTPGGATVAVTVTLDAANDRINVTFAAASWPASTITARKAVYYKARGGASSADELVVVKDFGVNVVSSGTTFNLNALTLRLQNPQAV